MEQKKEIRILLSHHRYDIELIDFFVKRLAPFQENGQLYLFKEELTGSANVTETNRNFENYQDTLPLLDVIILFISKKYLSLNSFIENRIPKKFLPLKKRGARIIAVYLEDCPWQSIGWLREMQIWPSHQLPFSNMSEDEKGKYISKLIEDELGLSKLTAGEKEEKTKYGEGPYGQGPYGGSGRDSEDDFENERQLCLAFRRFLSEKKGYPKSALTIQESDRGVDQGVDKGIRYDLVIFDHENQKQLAVVEFGLNEDNSTIKVAWEHFVYVDSQLSHADFDGYLVLPGESSLGEEFNIIKFSDNVNKILHISCADFPDYEELKQMTAGKKLTLHDFKATLDIVGKKICDKVIELAKSSKIKLYIEIKDESYINLRLRGAVNRNDNVIIQIHRWGVRLNIALAVIGTRKGEERKEPEFKDFLVKGDIANLSGYKSNISGEKAWLNGNKPYRGAREKATVYVLKRDILVNNDAWNEVEELFGWAIENIENPLPKEPEKPMFEPEAFSADEFYVADGKTSKDKLGFMPYVKAVAAFLTHEKTQPPLTMSVEGEWGSGKSSFMWQLQNEIKNVYEKKGKDREKCFIVEFEPWIHDKDEALWAAFTLDFVRQVSGQLGFWKGTWANCKLKWKRFDWREGWMDLVKKITLSLAWIIAIIGIVIGLWKGATIGKDGILELPAKLGAVAVVSASIWLTLRKVKECLGSPLAVDLKKYMKMPDYVSKVSFIEKFHKDFRKIVSAYAGKERVYVFIDDLDRCEVPKAAELMGSINLMLSKNPNLVFVLGMDRQKVAAGLAVKHEKLLRYLSGFTKNENEIDKDTAERMRGIRYGYSFIEKFIQVPFMLPIPRQGWIEEMLLELSGQGTGSERIVGVKKYVKKNRVSRLFSKLMFSLRSVLETAFRPILKRFEKTKLPAGDDLLQEEPKDKEEQLVEEALEAAAEEVFGDNDNFRRIVHLVSPYLDYNPRRVKQFVNLFRLRHLTARSTKLLEPKDSKHLTFEQLGKYVGIRLGWPLFIRDLERNYNLLDTLVDIAEGKKKPGKIAERIKEWERDEKLIGLIKSGCFDENKKKKTGGEYERFSMKGLDVEKLMKVAPRVEKPIEEISRADE